MADVKGFKVFNPDWTCRGFQYKVGEIYEEDVTPNVCGKGFHFCEQIGDCFSYYNFDVNNKVAEIIALGNIARTDTKCCTNKIKIVREIDWEEVLRLVNMGKNCTGLGNSGNYNSGNWNSGNSNSGNYNSGDYNNGNYNSGYHNSREHNSGSYNSGSCNSGNYNSGIINSGDCNSGDWNSGDFNGGNRNSGDYNNGEYNSGNNNKGNNNSGHFNNGNFNSGDYNKASYQTGCFNTQDRKLMFFDKETDMTFEEWRDSDAYRLMAEIDFSPVNWISFTEMSEVEKSEHPEYGVTGGYLKIQDNVNCYLEWWNNLLRSEKQAIMDIPNFDADKFFKITGIRI